MGGLTPPPTPAMPSMGINFTFWLFQTSMSDSDTDPRDMTSLKDLASSLVVAYLRQADTHNWKTGCPRPSLQFHQRAR